MKKNILIYSVVILSLIIQFFGLGVIGDIWGLFTLTVVALYIISSISKATGEANLFRLLFWLRVGLATFGEFVFNPGLPGKGKNAVAFWDQTMEILNGKLDLGLFVSFDVEYWPKILAICLLTFGKLKVTALIFNALLSTLGVYYIHRIASKIWENQRIANRVSLFYGILPYSIALGAVLLREAMIMLLLLSSVHKFCIWFKEDQSQKFLQAVLLLFAAGIFHGGVLSVLLIYLLVFARKFLKSRSVNKTAKNFIAVIFAIGTLAIAYNLEIGKTKLYSLYRLADGTEKESDRIENVVGSTVQWNSSGQYRQSFQYRVASSLVTELPDIVMPFYFYPYPWLIGSGIQYFNGVFSLIFLYVLITKFKILFKNKYSRLMIFIGGILLIIYAFGTSEYPAAVRHRNKALPFLFLAIAPVLSKKTYVYEG